MNKFGPDGWDHSNHLCSFGITEAIFGVGIADALGGGLLATGAADALGGAAVGAAGSALTGGNPLTGALTGGLTGGLVGGLGGVVGEATGLGAVGGDALVGAGAGALGSGLTGQNPITGALEGGVGGAVAGLAGTGTSGSPAAGAGGPGVGAGAIAAPASVAPDATAGIGGGFDTGGVPVGTELAASDTTSLNQQLALGASGDTTNTGLAVAGGGQNFGTASDLSQSQLGGLYAQGGGAVPGSAVSGGGGLGGVGGAGSADLSAGGGLASAGSDLIGVPPVPPGAPTATGGAVSGGVGSVIGGVSPSGSLLPGAANVSGGVGSFLGSNANWLLPAAVLGYDALKSNQGLGNIPGYNQLSGEAGQLASQGQQLASYLQSGTLPPGVQTSLNQAATAAQATIKSQYAARGMSGSSAEATDLANVQNTIVSQGANIATQLLQTGISEQNLSAQLYSQILNANLQNDNQLGQALTTLASGAARPTITVNQAG